MQTRRYKSIIVGLFTFLMILAPASYTAHAVTMDTDTMEAGSTGTVSGGSSTDTAETSLGTIAAITDSEGLPLESSYAVTVPAGDSEPLDELLWKVLRVYATMEGETETVTLNVDWDYNSLTANLDTPGEYTHTASILADGYTFADGVMQSLTIVVTVTEAEEKEPDVIWSFDSLSNRYAYAVAAGSDWQDFWDSYMSGGIWQSTWICYTAEGETLYADILWENPEPDMSRTGIVTVQGTAVLPENTVLAEGVTLPVVEVPVSIQSEPTLECWCADADVVYIPWVMGELENEDSLRFLASVNGGEWVDAGEWVDTNGASVCVWICYLEEGSTYQVKVVWDGGETNAFEFTWNGAVTDAGPVEGDRDGGDTGGNSINDIIQPEPNPEPDSTPESDSTLEPDSTPESDTTLEPDSTLEPEPTPESDTTLKPDPTLEPDSTLELDPTPESDSTLEPNPTLEPDSTPEPNPTLEPDPTLESDSTPEPNPTLEPDSTPEPDPALESDSTPEPNPTLEPDSTSEPGPALESDSTPEPNPTLEPDSTPEPDPALEPDSTPEPNPTLEPDSTPEPDPTPEPDSTLEPEPIISVPTPEISEAEPKETFYEEVTDTYSLLSGTRLLMMQQNGAVRFSKQGITITLSDIALNAMALTNDSRFLTEIEKTEQGFSLTVWLDGVPLTALPNTLVLCPFTPSADGSQISLLNVQDENVCEGNYDSEMGIVSFTIQTPGHYTIMETTGQDEAPLTPKDAESGQIFTEPEDVAVSQISTEKQDLGPFRLFLVVTVLSLAGLITGLFLWRRWRR